MHACVINLPILLYIHISMISILAMKGLLENKIPKPIYITTEIYLLF